MVSDYEYCSLFHAVCEMSPGVPIEIVVNINTNQSFVVVMVVVMVVVVETKEAQLIIFSQHLSLL